MAVSAIIQAIERHRTVVETLARDTHAIEQGSELLLSTIGGGGKVLIFGNGGSAASAQHFAAELTGRYLKERAPMPGIALTTDSSTLTAIGNDYGFEQVFERQVRALASEQDLLIGLSTSGRSENVIAALRVGAARKARLIALTGARGLATPVSGCVEVSVPTEETARIQEMHDLILHIWCEALDEAR